MDRINKTSESTVLELNDRLSQLERLTEDASSNEYEYLAQVLRKRISNAEEIYELEAKNANRLKNLEVDYETRLQDQKLKNLKAEDDAYNKLMKTRHAKELQQRQANAKALKAELEIQKQLIDDKTEQGKLELALLQDKLDLQDEILKNIQKETKEIENQAKKRAKAELSLAKTRETIDENQKKKQQREAGKQLAKDWMNGIIGEGFTLRERFSTLRSGFRDDDGNFDLKKGFALMTNALSSLTQKLDSKIDSIAGMKSAIDTRLQGSNNKTSLGSYWEQMSKDLTGVAGVSPLVKQEDIAKNISSLVSAGISYNVEQRAFLETIKDKIATTFDATNGTLLRLVRIQQQDTTAARLGMESALTSFLNNMYETTEYMKSISSNITSSLQETMSLMSSKDAVSLEYEVQKWMGSMFSVGVSDTAVNSIAQALGKTLAGDISGITSGGVGNLVVMAANEAGLSIADILRDGLNADETNMLLEQMTYYLGKLYDQSSDSRVIQQQLASVYGISASDLKAITNLVKVEGTMGSISGSSLTYENAMQQLKDMANSMWSRTSIGEMLTNAWDNFQYTMASGIASDPITYGIYKAAGLLDDLVGGIAIPMVSVMGNTVDLHTTIADLMRVGALSASAMKGIAAMIGAGSGGGLSGSGMLKALGIGENITTVSRGTISGKRTSNGPTVSESGGMVGNSASGDVLNKTMSDANDSQNSQIVSAKEDETEVALKDVNDSILLIYDLLRDVTTGAATFHCESEAGGLTTPNSWTR